MQDHAGRVGRTFYAGLLEALTRVMATAKDYLSEHAPRVAYLSRQLAPHLGLDRRETSELFFAAVLCDLGMIGLAEDAWDNPTPALDPATRQRVDLHPIRSEQAVSEVPHLNRVGRLVRHHHEWWNGDGYPDGLAGEDIPLGSRILRVADTICALAAHRPQRPALDEARIRAIVEDSRGTELCPAVTDVWLDLSAKGRIERFDQAEYQRTVGRAAEHLLPAEVSPISADHLLDILAHLIDQKDPYTAGHSRRVAILSVAVATQLGLDDRFRSTIWAAGYLHDLGKLAVPLRVLLKEGPLAPDEWKAVQSHAGLGADVLQTIHSLRHLSTGARYHHERWDGSGYPEGLTAENIPMIGRILAVCDAYDAMTSIRAYRSGRSHAQATEEIANCTGVHFCPRVAAAFLTLPEHLFHSVRQSPSQRADFFPPEALTQRPSGAWRSRITTS